MAVPSLSGITVLSPWTGNAGWVLAPVANATAAFPTSGTSNNNDLRGNGPALILQNAGTAVVANVWYSAWQPFPNAINLSSGCLAFHCQLNNSVRINSDADSFRIVLFSGSGTTEYRSLGLGSRGDFILYELVVITSSTEFVIQETAGFDITNVTKIGFVLQAGEAGTQGFIIRGNTLLHVPDAIKYINGDSGARGRIADLYQKLFDLPSLIAQNLGGFYNFTLPVSLENEEFLDEKTGVSFSPVGRRNMIPESFYKLEVKGNVSLSNSITVTDLPLAVNVSADAKAIFLRQSSQFAEGNFTSVIANGGTIRLTGSYADRGNITFNGGESLNLALSNCGLVTIAGTLLPSVLEITNPRFDALQFNSPPNSTYQFAVEGTVNLNYTAGSHNLGGLTNSGASIEFDELTGGDYFLEVSSGLVATVASPTTGGGSVTLVAPQVSITLTNIPNVAGALVGVIDLTTSTPFFPTVTGSTCTFATNPGTNYFIAVGAPGWIRQAITLSGAAGTFELDWSGRNFRALYDLGDPTYEGIAIDFDEGPTQFEATIDDSETDLTFATVFARIEKLLAVPEAIFFPNPPIPQIIEPGSGISRNYLIFPFDEAANEPNPVTVRPHPDNLIDPRFVDFVAIWPGAEDPFYSNVLTNPDNGRRIRIQTEALGVAVEVSGGLSTEDRAVIDAIAADATDLAATLADPGVFSPAALANTPGGSATIDPQGVADALLLAPTAGTPAEGSVYAGLGAIASDANDLAAALEAPGVFSEAALANAPVGEGLTPEQLREAVGLEAADLDEQLGELLTADDPRLDNLDTKVSSRLARPFVEGDV